MKLPAQKSSLMTTCTWCAFWLAAILLVLGFTATKAAPPIQFVEHTIATGLSGGYQVVVADLNQDGKPDLIALASGLPELVWFENPGWQRHVIASTFTQMINCVALNSGGHPKIVLASGFSNEAAKSSGTVWLLEPDGDVLRPWKAREIDRLPTSHRLRVADIDGNGNPIVLNAPLTDAQSGPPDYRSQTPLVYYRTGDWQRQLISDQNEGVMHGICVCDWDGNRHDQILTASFGGIHRYKRQSDGTWARTEIAHGAPAPWPRCGASDVAVGQLGGRRFVCSIEPWHGNQVAVYHDYQGQWVRQVIDDSFHDGHALATADFNRDGRDEIIAGYRGAGGGLVYYTAEDELAVRWQRHDISHGTIATASCAVADLNGDGKLDIVAVGSATGNLVWFENTLTNHPVAYLRTEKLAEMDAAIEQAIARKQCPGGVLWFEHGGQSYHKAYGRRAVVPASERMTEDTIFDAASLTKVVATTPAILLLIERGQIELDAPAQTYLPEFQGQGKEAITIRQLLTHTSGLRGDIETISDWHGQAAAIQKACEERLVSAPGTAFRYSDINFFLLGEIVQRVSKVPLEEFVAREVYRPLNMTNTGYLPVASLRPRIAPTEVAHGEPLRGVVHDPTARHMGGVAGHAGLFFTAEDLARYARMLLNGGALDGVQIFKPETVKLMTSVQSPEGVTARRGLGWDIDTGYSGPRGSLFPVGSYGHTGWTGTSLWIDPSSQSFVIFLSNRNHPTESGNVGSLRAELGTLAAEATGVYDHTN
jgi:CubicO group peptidase (beta-lactamase class C family)